jgi:hypothetical protein
MIERVEEEDAGQKDERALVKTELRNSPNLNSGMVRSTNESKDTMIQLSHREKDGHSHVIKIANVNKPICLEIRKSGENPV